jgi:hypothetical protein
MEIEFIYLKEGCTAQEQAEISILIFKGINWWADMKDKREEKLLKKLGRKPSDDGEE